MLAVSGNWTATDSASVTATQPNLSRPFDIHKHTKLNSSRLLNPHRNSGTEQAQKRHRYMVKIDEKWRLTLKTVRKVLKMRRDS